MLMLDTEIGEADAAAPAQQTPIPVEVNVPAIPELSLVEMTQVWTLGVGSDRSLGRPKEWFGAGASSDGTRCNTVVSDPGSSVSQRVQAVNSSPVSPVCWSEPVDGEEDWPDEWWHNWESDWMEGTFRIRKLKHMARKLLM